VKAIDHQHHKTPILQSSLAQQPQLIAAGGKNCRMSLPDLAVLI